MWFGGVETEAQTRERNLQFWMRERKNSWEWIGNIREPNRLCRNVQERKMFLAAETDCSCILNSVCGLVTWLLWVLPRLLVRWRASHLIFVFRSSDRWVWHHHYYHLCLLNVWYNCRSHGRTWIALWILFFIIFHHLKICNNTALWMEIALLWMENENPKYLNSCDIGKEKFCFIYKKKD